MGNRLLGVLALLCACSATPHPDRPEPQPHACKAACETLERLGCESAKPTATGGTCEANCMNIEMSGAISMCPVQVARSRDCVEAEALSQCEAP